MGLAVQDDDYLLQQAKISSPPSMNDKTVPNKICPPRDSKSNLGLQTSDISKLSHTGLLQCIRPHSDHSYDLDNLEKGFQTRLSHDSGSVQHLEGFLKLEILEGSLIFTYLLSWSSGAWADLELLNTIGFSSPLSSLY